MMAGVQGNPTKGQRGDVHKGIRRFGRMQRKKGKRKNEGRGCKIRGRKRKRGGERNRVGVQGKGGKGNK
jgi:hypothetical protein